MEKITALLESIGEDVLAQNEEVISEMISDVNELPKHLKAFVLANPTEFVGESVEETYKNVRIFAEVSTAQYLAELSHLYAPDMTGSDDEVVEETEQADINDYL